MNVADSRNLICQMTDFFESITVLRQHLQRGIDAADRCPKLRGTSLLLRAGFLTFLLHFQWRLAIASARRGSEEGLITAYADISSKETPVPAMMDKIWPM